MATRLRDGTGPVLADTSAWMQARREAAARDLLLAAIERGDVRWCWPVRYELTIDARGSDGIATVERTWTPCARSRSTAACSARSSR